MKDLYMALGLVLVIEGVTYALFPEGMQRAMTAMREMAPGALRMAGLFAAVVGVVIVWLIRS